MPNKPLALIQKRFRKYIWKAFGERFLHNPACQQLLGYTIRDGMVADSFDGLHIRYKYDSLLGKCVFLSGEYENEDAFFCRDLIQRTSNPVVLDVGANIGLHSMRWLGWNPAMKIISVEANPATAAMLEANIRLNQFQDRCTIRQVALGDRDGEIDFIITTDDAFGGMVKNERSRELDRISVRMTTLDHLVSALSLGRLDLVKIDVEGAESLVISGAAETLRKFQPCVYMEIYSKNNPGVDPATTVRQMQALNYRAYVMVGGVPKEWSSHSDLRPNYFFEPAGAASRV